MKSPSLQTVKRLFAVSHNLCAFPSCTNPLVEESGTVTGEIAHICASSPDGPRYDSNQSDAERHGFDNLMLLCSRHHTVIDTEINSYRVPVLVQLKREHESGRPGDMAASAERIAKRLVDKYKDVVIINSAGHVAYNSPGSIQAQTINLKTTKRSVRFNPPADAIGSASDMASYVEYLIKKYQEYQKLDTAKEGNRKYQLIYIAIGREFGSKWQVLHVDKFGALVEFLLHRIDNSKIGRIRKARGQKPYHTFEEHGQNADD